MDISGRAVRSSLVYSTESGRICPACRQPRLQCQCRQAAAPPAGDGTVRVSRETKGRKGKAVTLISGVPLDAASLDVLARQLKAACGSGGTVKNGVIEIQGDHRDRVIEALGPHGWVVKRAGA